MKKSFTIFFFILISNFIFSEEFKGFYDIEFGQSPEEVKTNIVGYGFKESELSALAKCIRRSKKDAGALKRGHSAS